MSGEKMSVDEALEIAIQSVQSAYDGPADVEGGVLATLRALREAWPVVVRWHDSVYGDATYENLAVKADQASLRRKALGAIHYLIGEATP